VKKKAFLNCCFILIISISFAQTSSQIARPKLVIGLVIDQMRWDYLYRYNQLYGNGGFKRLLNEGFSCENTMIPYIPTYTAPGHSCIYTGSIPAINGIIGNNWIDKKTNRNIYCTDDSTVIPLGTSSDLGKMSPRKLLTTTITDELKLSNNFQSKVIGIALKDRSSILPAGHTANAAYWYDDRLGNWISSSYYMSSLPVWVKQLNEKSFPSAVMSKDWNTLLPITNYLASTPDIMNYESPIPGETSVSFPHRLHTIDSGKYEAFKYTPFANSYTFDMAKAAIENEHLGNSRVTDFLAISISSTDYIGHRFGPNSIETEDTYLRLDKNIEDFLVFLDSKLGRGNYLLFLSADHGVAHTPEFSRDHKVTSGTFSETNLAMELNRYIEKRYQIKNAILIIENFQVYLNTAELEKNNKLTEVKMAVIVFLKQKDFIQNAFELETISNQTIPVNLKNTILNSYYPNRSGEIQFLPMPGYFDGEERGTSHGTGNPYDAHIPLIWYGWNIKAGKTNRETYMTDIAPTIAAMLKIQMSSGSVGKVITEITGQGEK
jgi:predicted AlkP superfamily pyrophosphatase or phosphodiesterase